MTDIIQALSSFNLGGAGHAHARRFFTNIFSQDPTPVTTALLDLVATPDAQIQLTIQTMPDAMNLNPISLKSMAILLLNQELGRGDDPVILNFPKAFQNEIHSKLLSFLLDPSCGPLHRVLCITITTFAHLQLVDEAGWPELIPTLFHWIGLGAPGVDLAQPNIDFALENSLLHHSFTILTDIATNRFDALIPHLETVQALLGSVYSQGAELNALNALATRVKVVHLIRHLVPQPEVQDSSYAYFNAVMSTLRDALENNKVRQVKSILGWLVELVTEEGEIAFFKPHLLPLIEALKPIAMAENISEEITELALEFFVSLIELRPAFANGVQVTKAIKKKATSSPPTPDNSPSLLLTQTVFEIVCSFMSQITVDPEWCQLSPVDRDEGSGNNDGDYYSEHDQHHNTGLYAFSRFVSCLTQKRLKAHILPQILSVLRLPSLPHTQLPQPITLEHCLVDDNYNIHWRNHVIALRLLTQFSHPTTIPLSQLPMTEIFTLLTSAHPRVQYAALGTLSVLASEYKSSFSLLAIEPFLNTIQPLLGQMHLPHIQQMVCTCLQVILSEMTDVENDGSEERDEHEPHYQLPEAKVALMTKVNALFPPKVFSDLIGYLMHILEYYHDNQSLKLKTIGLQINIITCIAELSSISPLLFVPHFAQIQSKLITILQENVTQSPDFVYLQCKVVEATSFILNALFTLAQTFPLYPPSLLPPTQTPGTIPSPAGDFPFEIGAFSEEIQDKQAFGFGQTALQFYQHITSIPQLRSDHNIVLKYVLRAFTRICPILKYRFEPLMGFVMGHLVSQLTFSISTRINHNLVSSNSPDGDNDSTHTLLFDDEEEENKGDTDTEAAAGALGGEGSGLGQNQDQDQFGTVTSKRIGAEQLELFYDDVSTSLSMLQTYLMHTPLLTIPWSYDVTKILLYYINYPQNIEIQGMVGTILPHFMDSLSQFVVESGVDQSGQGGPSLAQNGQQGQIFANSYDITTYHCYQSRSDFFSPFLIKQQKQQQSQQGQQHESTFFYTPSNPTLGQNDQNGQNSQHSQILQTSSVKSIFAIREVLGPRFHLPSIHHVSSIIVYVMEYLLYLLRQESDNDIVSTLLSSLSSCSDHLSPYLLSLSNYHIVAVIIDYVLMLSYKSQERISKQISLLLTQISKKHQSAAQNSALVDSDFDSDADESDADIAENEVTGPGNADGDRGDEEDANKGKKKEEKKLMVFIPQQELSKILSPTLSQALYNHYQQYPFDDNTLTLLTRLNDFISEQLLMILNRIFATVKSSFCGGLGQNDQNGPKSLLDVILPRIISFAQILLVLPPSQHPLALEEVRTFRQSQQQQLLVEAHFGQNQNFLQNPTLSEIPPHQQYLAQTYTLKIRKLPYLLFHSLFSAYKHDLGTLLYQNESNFPFFKYFFSSFLQFSHLTLSQTQSTLSLYLSTYDLIKSGASNIQPQVLSALDQVMIEGDKGFFVKLFHNQNPGVLLEHLGYALGLLAEFFSSHHTPQVGAQAFGFYQQGMSVFDGVMLLETEQNQQNQALTPQTLITTLGSISAHLRLYFQSRFKNTFVATQQFITPPTAKQMSAVFTSNSSNQKARTSPHLDFDCDQGLTTIPMTPVCSMYAYGSDNIVMCYTRWVLAGLQILSRSGLTIGQFSPQQQETASFYINHLTLIISTLTPLLRDAGELAIMYQLIVNYALTGNIDQSLDDVESLQEMSFPPTNFPSSPQAQKRLESINNWHQLNTQGGQNPEQQQPTLVGMMIAFSPFRQSVVGFNPSPTHSQINLTLLFPLFLFLSRGLLIPDIIQVCRISIAALFNLILVPFVPHELCSQLTYAVVPKFIPSQLLLPLDLSLFNQMQYEWVVGSGIVQVGVDEFAQQVQSQHPILSAITSALKPHIASDLDILAVECTTKLLISSFYGMGH